MIQFSWKLNIFVVQGPFSAFKFFIDDLMKDPKKENIKFDAKIFHNFLFGQKLHVEKNSKETQENK